MANNTLIIEQLGNRFVDYRKECWGDSYNWSFNRKLDQVVKLAIHHSVTAPSSDWKAEVDRIGELHKARSWNGFGYHFVISTQGIVAYVGDIGTGRANIANHNEKIIGICLIGDFTKHLPTDIQINSAHDICNFFINNYPSLKNINNWEDLMGHKDAVSLWGNTTATACPGSSWPFDMKSRIKDNVPYGPAPASSNTLPSTPKTEPVVLPESSTVNIHDDGSDNNSIDHIESPSDIPTGVDTTSSDSVDSVGSGSPTAHEKTTSGVDPITAFFNRLISFIKSWFGR